MRLIDADALIAEISNPKYPYTYDAEHVFTRMIDNAPTVDAVPVVRCKDCESWNQQECVVDGNCWCDMLERFTWNNFFCADGERRGKDAFD